MTNPVEPEDEAEETGSGSNVLMIFLAVLFAIIILCLGCCGVGLWINYELAN